MKKIILFAAFAMGAVASQAQTTVAGSKFFDNWSFTLKGGMVSPMENVGFFKAAAVSPVPNSASRSPPSSDSVLKANGA